MEKYMCVLLPFATTIFDKRSCWVSVRYKTTFTKELLNLAFALWQERWEQARKKLKFKSSEARWRLLLLCSFNFNSWSNYETCLVRDILHLLIHWLIVDRVYFQTWFLDKVCLICFCHLKTLLINGTAGNYCTAYKNCAVDVNCHSLLFKSVTYPGTKNLGGKAGFWQCLW